MSDSPLVLQREGSIVTVVFNRPEQINALDLATAVAFEAACRSIADDPSTRVVVIRGEGRSFGVGGDLQGFRSGDAPSHASRLIEPLHRGLKLLAALDAPTIASLHGNVAGGSMSLALNCDLAIAADNVRFNLAYTNVATNCDLGGSWALPRLVGLRRALQIALIGEPIGAQEALMIGLVNRVVESSELEAATRALARHLAQGPTLAYGRMKQLLRGSFEHSFAQQLDLEQESFEASAGTRDFAEAIHAFFQRRSPSFNGT
ncbi:enoyl-CoA hydratase/isomerase family protein [Paraburkholderia xenovorans LB400]|uniref:Enoyl-CoA hydratase n=1 Tax=Paraburkholderia xenovorans (strain LB400) TaxID=266265 RepID=Q13I44_PARXL|nr:enoyl-CoA hydratase-related protein [Paraburkholderia xenovorans]ABE36245.1 Enoyl-CoA hydratase [Paraburkholderia xenovorans LB400]AIP34418.1 enoyl-CoA hydratase/isomerase family protein [Paraburkholderia xenovorans LB400]